MLNKNTIQNELPKFPVGQTLKKFYKPKLIKNTSKTVSMNQKPGWKIYTKSNEINH